jgi:two-component system, response regulator PdtaR
MKQTIADSKHLMLVDDDSIVLGILADGLRDIGYLVSAYSDPETALADYKTKAPDVAIVDYRMSGMDGLKLATAMIAACHRPIVMLSAYRDIPLVREAVDVGISAYIVKPVEAERLAPTIEAALARFNETEALLKHDANLRDAVESNRVISTAVGIVMASLNLPQDAAFENLRRLARQQRSSLRQVAFDLVDATSTANAILQQTLHI